MRFTLMVFSFAVLGFYILLWGAQWLFPGATASSVVLVLVTIAGVVLVRPGWKIRPGRPAGYWAVLLAVLLGSAAVAAYVLRLIEISTPYDTLTLDIVTILPGVIAVTCIEELLFRQVMFRWLEEQQISGKGAVLATAVAFAGAHLGPLLLAGSVDGLFYLLQSLYMLWVGLVLGELRRVTDSWVMSWAGHACYNAAVLSLFSHR
jgi:Type II CAAX prenyl endopeptidase Rce1-like